MKIAKARAIRSCLVHLWKKVEFIKKQHIFGFYVIYIFYNTIFYQRVFGQAYIELTMGVSNSWPPPPRKERFNTFTIVSSGMSSYSPRFASSYCQNCCGITRCSQVNPFNNFDNAMMKTVVNKRTYHKKL
jgi:hypothetical protein